MPNTTSSPLDRDDHPQAAPIAAPLSANALLPRIGLVIAASAVVLWGAWATHTLLGLSDHAPRLVKVELADLVREYVQREARSGEPAEAITAHTAQFLKALNGAVSAHATKGTIVLLGNAVVDGDVPDITGAVRAEVYAHQPRNASPGEDGHGTGH